LAFKIIIQLSGKQKILIHKDELKGGVDVESLAGLDFIDLEQHRDDHYMFILLLKGLFVFELDFNEIMLKDASICYVTPGQVQRYLASKGCEGWLVFVDADLIPKQYRAVFDTFLNSHQVVSAHKDDQVYNLPAILEKWLADDEAPLSIEIATSLIHGISGMITSKILASQKTAVGLNTSKYALANKFKQHVKDKFKESKQVKVYAALLNITPLYLNEVMNEITGFSASYWIQQEVLLEAKRLLSYTGMDVNEIAYELGYEDAAYFSRFFKKNAGVTASDFRNRKP
jgi:AraC family transcriptional regulator, transcriptional activator of pobA